MKKKRNSLQDQCFIYGFETKSLFTDEEKATSDRIDKLSREKNKMRKESALISQAQRGEITRAKFETGYRAIYNVKKGEPILDDYADRQVKLKERVKEINEQISQLKAELKELFQNNTQVRRIREDAVVDTNVISVFESTLTRTLGMETNKLYKDITIIRIFYYEILKDIMLNGFLWGEDKYVCFTASAGQIRTKKVVFIREKSLEKVSPSIMCGLSIADINAKGGININKLLAYMALSNSATNHWKNFDITKTIVVDDFETDVSGTVDFIDEKTYTVERKEMEVPIAHTDGCGMMLPRVNKKNMMVRAPWVKGLLAVFPYDRFIKEANERDPTVNHALVTDIYGKEHDVLAEDIEVIFTKSQFKLWKYYDSWEEYQRKFIENHSMAGTCNEEDDYISNAKINYQMLQTLSGTTYEEMTQLADKTNRRIKNIASSKDTMLAVFGAGDTPKMMNGFQKCLNYYPELLNDEYTRNTLKLIKKRLVKNARAGKLDIEGKYLFLVPDLYAFCERLFLKEENPKGLLANGEVYCRPYKDFDTLDCLRSPHLYMEHALRKNVVDQERNRWFSPRAIYTSCHDLISKILQFDVDGDKSLVVAEPLLVKIAERHSEGIVPLYYEMAKAGAVQVNNQQMYEGMVAAYSGGKIGQVSNDITKIWNSGNVSLEAIKMLCMENNFTIDYAKTLYKPTRPAHVNTLISSYTKKRTPHFFVYAKDKLEESCEPKNESVVNMLEDIVENKRMCFTAKDLGHFRYQLMMQNESQSVDPDVVKRFMEMDGSAYRQISMTHMDEDADYGYLRIKILAEMALMAGSVECACDMLIKTLFTKKTIAHKSTFWLCFGDIVYENLRANIGENAVQCAKCGRRFVRKAPNQFLCESCSTRTRKEVKVRPCVDCGSPFVVGARNNKKVRCDDCQLIYRRQYKTKYQRTKRAAACAS